MAQIANYTFDQNTNCKLIDSAGPEDNSGWLYGDAFAHGGVGHFDGHRDYGLVKPDPIFGLDQGTIAIEFTQEAPSCGNYPWNGAQTLFSTDAHGLGAEGGHLSIFINACGEIVVRHQTDDQSHYYSGGKVVPGEPVQMSYSFGPEGSVLSVNGTVVDTGCVPHHMAGDTNPIAIGAGLTSASEGTANDVRGFFNGEIDRVAIYDTIERPDNCFPCFVAGTMVLTPTGQVPIETLKPGDLVTTMDCGPQPVVCVTQTRVDARTLKHTRKSRPISVPVHAAGQPAPVHISRQHCVMMQAGDREVLVRAAHLEKVGMATQDDAASEVIYVHLLLKDHHVICADGAPCETLKAGKMADRNLRADGLDETANNLPYMLPARPILDGRQVRALHKAGKLNFARWSPHFVQVPPHTSCAVASH
ncbi:Hint domain-containing protein [Shimia isoporae]|uniref:Hint domain-containing protein n=1 Tax=Shimia isoporae TaxID=647720 RepID=A0A4R1N2W7_9RHOB|nr:Hint domain-containing protein [Shimia isoporae]TCL00741.1 Hint domain-containing protein [Shimia isoporae]